MRLILHIGWEKTGSTSIQKYLNLNREKLANLGIAVEPRIGTWEQQEIAASFYTQLDDFWLDPRFAGLDLEAEREILKSKLAEFVQSLKEDSTVILSSEHFSSRIALSEELEELSEFISKYFEELVIVVYLRDQATLAEAAHWEMMKAGLSDSIPMKPNDELKNSRYFRYDEVLSDWLKSFPKTSFRIRNYDSIIFSRLSVVQDFVSVLEEITGHTDFPIPDSADPFENKTPNSFTLELLRSVNIKLIEALPPSEKLRPFLHNRALRASIIKALTEIEDISAKARVDRTAWKKAFSESNQALAGLFPGVGQLFTADQEFYQRKNTDNFEFGDLATSILTQHSSELILKLMEERLELVQEKGQEIEPSRAIRLVKSIQDSRLYKLIRLQRAK